MQKTQQLMNIYKVYDSSELCYTQLAEENKPNQLWKVEYEGGGAPTEVCAFTEKGYVIGYVPEEDMYFCVSFFGEGKKEWVAQSPISIREEDKKLFI